MRLNHNTFFNAIYLALDLLPGKTSGKTYSAIGLVRNLYNLLRK